MELFYAETLEQPNILPAWLSQWLMSLVLQPSCLSGYCPCQVSKWAGERQGIGVLSPCSAAFLELQISQPDFDVSTILQGLEDQIWSWSDEGCMFQKPQWFLGSINFSVSSLSQRHPFFRHINWDDLIARRVDPPFRPSLVLPTPLLPSLGCGFVLFCSKQFGSSQSLAHGLCSLDEDDFYERGAELK